MKVNVVDLETWLYRWVESHLDCFEDGGWVNVDKVPGFLSFDIRIENGKLLYVPFDVNEDESLMDQAEVLISLKGIDTSYEQIITTVRNDTGEFVVTKGVPCRFSYDNPTVYFYDPRFEGRFGQYVSSYLVKTFQEIGEGKGLMLDGAVSTHILTPANVAHIKTLL